MPSYVVSGAARGLGYEFTQQISRDSSNTVFALVRNVETATSLNELSSSRKNIHVIKCDVTNPSDIEAAATAVGKVTGGSLDVLIHNAYAVDFETVASDPTAFTTEKSQLAKKAIDVALGTAVYGALWLTNAFLPLIRKGKDKKIIHLSSGIADLQLIEQSGVTSGVPYAISKASANIIVAKFAAELRSEGIWVLALSPGWVNTQDPNQPGTCSPNIQCMLTVLTLRVATSPS